MTNLKHRRRANKRNLIEDQSEDSVDNKEANEEYNDNMAKSDTDLLKTLLVKDCSGEDLTKIHNLLTKTLKYRRELSKSEDVNLLQEFPYYFTRPDLVTQKAIMCNTC